MPKPKKRRGIRIVLYIIVALAALGALVYGLRYRILEWYLDGYKPARETVVLEMTARAKAVIEKELHMTIPQSILSFLTGRRSEDARERDAIKDVTSFAEFSFKNRWLRFIDVHGEIAIQGFNLEGADMALEWRRGTPEVLASFRVNIIKGLATGMRVNENCSFFAELKSYVETRAREN